MPEISLSLQSNFEREIKNAESSLERTEKLKKQLETWKVNTRFQNKVRYIKICDMHDKILKINC